LFLSDADHRTSCEAARKLLVRGFELGLERADELREAFNGKG
jgi:hypothetical protein